MHPTREELSSHLRSQLEGAISAVQALPRHLPAIVDAAELLVDTLGRGSKVLTAGNGGSAAEAMHMAEELCGRYKSNRKSLPGLSLTADGTALTCIANDFGFDEVFARQVEGLGCRGDLLVLFSTSGNAANLMRALRQARTQELRVLSILGRDGGPLAGLSDVEILLPSRCTEHVQEAHQVILHLLLEAVELACGGSPGFGPIAPPPAPAHKQG